MVRPSLSLLSDVWRWLLGAPPWTESFVLGLDFANSKKWKKPCSTRIHLTVSSAGTDVGVGRRVGIICGVCVWCSVKLLDK